MEIKYRESGSFMPGASTILPPQHFYNIATISHALHICIQNMHRSVAVTEIAKWKTYQRHYGIFGGNNFATIILFTKTNLQKFCSASKTTCFINSFRGQSTKQKKIQDIFDKTNLI